MKTIGIIALVSIIVFFVVATIMLKIPARSSWPFPGGLR
jgi:hypothetical protein